jgi:Tol biopolymer transport system component
MLEVRTLYDKWTGRTIKAIGRTGSDTGQHYFTANTWLSDSRRLVLSAHIDESRRCRYVLFDTDSGRSQSIVDDAGWGAGIVSSDAAASPDDRWVVADTHEHGSKIVLVDAENGTSRPLCEVRRWEEHPGHPHPAFSPDSRKVSFTFADEENRLWVGIVEI